MPRAATQPDDETSNIVSHGTQAIRIGNTPISVEHQTVPIDQLQLDPDNPRLRYLVRNLGHQPTVKQLGDLLEKEDFAEDLLRQIRDNGGVLDPIHALQDGTVVEGNTRLVCLKRLARNNPGDSRWRTVPVLRLPDGVAPHLISVLQGSFHVQSKNKWKAYAKAEHLHHMHTINQMSFEAIGRALGMQTRVVERLVQQYGVMATEILPKLKGDLRRGIKLWSHVDELFKRGDLDEFRSNKANLKQFADWVVSGRLKGGADVRKLSKVLAKPKAKEALQKHGVDAAVAIVRRSDPTVDSQAFRKIADAATTLKELSGSDLEQLRTEDSVQALFRELYSRLQQAAKVAKFKLE